MRAVQAALALLLAAADRGKRVVIYCPTGKVASQPGNALGERKPSAQAMDGMLRLYERSS